MIAMTKRDAVDAAMSVAQDVADGRLIPADLERHVVAELHELSGQVIGPGDPLWETQVGIARGVLAAGGIPADELSEWLAVERQRAGESLSQPEPDQIPPEPIPLPSGPLSPESPEPEVDISAVDIAVAPVNAPRQADGYDPLAGWSPGGTRRS